MRAPHRVFSKSALALLLLAALAGCKLEADRAPSAQRGAEVAASSGQPAAGSGQPAVSQPAVKSGQPADTADSGLWLSLPAGQVEYYPPGEFLKGGFPVVPERAVARFEPGISIMKRQVSQAEYAACVKARACKPLDKAHRDAVSPDLPVVGVSWRDAAAYAEWLSSQTGRVHRLPAYEEWIYAAGPEFTEDIVMEAFDPTDPAQRWLAEYKLETQRKASVDATPRPFGGFGVNSAGMQDMVGNVWDWTSSCHTRHNLDFTDKADASASMSPDPAASFAAGAQNCGIRVVAGPHRSYIADFIRDPKSGACSVGVPPSNLGFRLVREDIAPSSRKPAS